MDPALYNALLGVFAAAIYAIAYYAQNNSVDPANFNWAQFIATVIVGGALGFASVVFLGNPVSQTWIVAQLAAYAGATAIVTNILVAIYNYFKPPASQIKYTMTKP